ncbi:hypothetical protein Pan258_29940 [Symmachiella dynata]|uniref:Uncharacterized protein n=1 Tax=Symmachiella dynata TaxID=2527995 RepID=A0A517ZQ85_9PLAN|nr:hypothetical protein Pan258_29940 [Symmachiella dynata]QDU44607.1 hypothetical protein Mal52_30930 [Symmachiella dynata]|tara:strand:- start:89 stop:307 length:219 start_codon:yes stop_codon:yes gene_type:complete
MHGPKDEEWNDWLSVDGLNGGMAMIVPVFDTETGPHSRHCRASGVRDNQLKYAHLNVDGDFYKDLERGSRDE